VQGLKTSPIHRLTYLWEELQKDKKIYGTWKNIETMVVGDSSMKDYRVQLRTVAPPIVPFLAVLLKDLVYLEDGNPDYLNLKDRKDIVNITKMVLLSKQIDSLVMYQNDVYPFSKDTTIYEYFTRLKCLTEEDFWKLSYHHVPRGKAQK